MLVNYLNSINIILINFLIMLIKYIYINNYFIYLV